MNKKFPVKKKKRKKSGVWLTC